LPSRPVVEKKLAKYSLTISIVVSLMRGLAPTVLSGGPTVSNLSGADSSMDNDVAGVRRRFSIDRSIAAHHGP